MARVVPVPLLSLFTGPELETMVCGSPDIPLDLLKSVVTYKGVDASAPLVRWFWDTLESFSNAERSLFLRFVWGRTRLPRTIVDFRGRDFVFQVSDHGSIHRPKASHSEVFVQRGRYVYYSILPCSNGPKYAKLHTFSLFPPHFCHAYS